MNDNLFNQFDKIAERISNQIREVYEVVSEINQKQDKLNADQTLSNNEIRKLNERISILRNDFEDLKKKFFEHLDVENFYWQNKEKEEKGDK